MTEITPEEEKIYKETFAALDTNKRGKINLDLIGYALRINNQCPSEAEVQEILQSYTTEDESGNIPKINLEEFMAIMKENSKPKEDLQTNIIDAFIAFDKNESGLIEETKLREILATMGEVLDEAEINEFIKDAKPTTDGKIGYDDLAKLLMTAYSRPASKKKKASAKPSAKKGKK